MRIHRMTSLAVLGSLCLAAASNVHGDLIGYWPLDDAEGDVVSDQSGNEFHGMTVGTPEWVDGVFGGGLQFNGGGDRVEIEDDEILRFTIDDSFTAMAWVFIPENAGSGWRGVVNKSRDQAPWWGIWINPQDQWVYGENGNHMQLGLIEEGWHHLAIIQDADDAIQYLYLDGDVLGEYDGLEPQDGGGDLWFGGANSVDEWFLGTLDEVRVYDTALSFEEVLEAMAGPSGGGAGDFNGNGELDLDDVNQLESQIVAGTNDLTYDLSQDNQVDLADLDVWVKDLKGTWMGDANLDGQFNTDDLVAVLATGTYEDGVAGNSDWSSGDWNADAEFTTADLVVALSDGGYEQGPRAAEAVAVPEPVSWVLIGSAFVGLILCRERMSSTRTFSLI